MQIAKKKKPAKPQLVTRTILRQEFSRLDTKIDGVEKRLDAKIDGVEKRLDAKIDGVEKRLDTKIDGVEKRLDAKIDNKIDIAVQSMKDYTDSRFTQLENVMQAGFQRLGDKLDISVNGIIKFIESGVGKQSEVSDRVDDHEERIARLEEKVG